MAKHSSGTEKALNDAVDTGSGLVLSSMAKPAPATAAAGSRRAGKLLALSWGHIGGVADDDDEEEEEDEEAEEEEVEQVVRLVPRAVGGVS